MTSALGGGGVGILQISGWGCAAGTLRHLGLNTETSYPILDLVRMGSIFMNVSLSLKLPGVQ